MLCQTAGQRRGPFSLTERLGFVDDNSHHLRSGPDVFAGIAHPHRRLDAKVTSSLTAVARAIDCRGAREAVK